MDARKIANIDFDAPAMKAFDWGLSFASLGWGAYSGSTLWIVAGLLGAAASWYRPLSRFQRWMNGFVARRT